MRMGIQKKEERKQLMPPQFLVCSFPKRLPGAPSKGRSGLASRGGPSRISTAVEALARVRRRPVNTTLRMKPYTVKPVFRCCLRQSGTTQK